MTIQHCQQLERKRMRKRVSPCFPYASLMSGVIYLYRIVICYQALKNYMQTDLRLTEVFVPYLAFFLVLLYKCKASPPLNNTVMSIFVGFISSFFIKMLFCFLLYCVYPPLDCDDMYLTHPSFLCVLISNVCGFLLIVLLKKIHKDKRESES